MKTLFVSIAILVMTSTANAIILKKDIPDKLVVLTFDDATASHYSVVAPLLRQYGFGATFFVCEFPPNFKDKTKYMTWEQIKDLDEMGFEIANHTYTHASLDRLSEEQINEQLAYIEVRCESLGIHKPTSFAYPGYGLNSLALDILKKRGYTFARAGGRRAYDPLNDHPFLIPSWAMNDKNKPQIMEALNHADAGKVVVLTIHGVPDVEHHWVNTSPSLFEEYLRYFSEQDFTVIALRDLHDYINVKEALDSIDPDLNQPLKN